MQKEQPKHLAYLLTRIQDVDESLATLMESIPAAGASAGAQRPGGGDINVEILKAKVEQLEQQVQQCMRQGGAPAGGATGGSSQASGGAEASATADVSCVPLSVCSLGT